MQTQKLSKAGRTGRTLRAGKALPLLLSVWLAGCASYAGISSDRQVTDATALQTAASLPAEQGRWPAPDWAAQFGDAQLRALIAEAIDGSPSIDMAKARLAAAAAFSEGANANTLPRVDASYAWTRQQYSGGALVPPPYASSWQTENRGLISATYELDLWGKNREALASSVSARRAAEAESEQVRLSVSSAVARAYNELARLYTLRDIAQDEVAQRTALARLTHARAASGLDTEVEQRTAEGDLDASQAALKALDGALLATRYQLGALLGRGPDRGLAIARPAMGPGDEVRLPGNLPADLVSRRPDIVAARWRVDASTHDIKVAKAGFYPDINLSAAIGLDAFGFGRFLTAASRIANAGPAIHLPIFDAGALRAQLKGRYAEFDMAVANYNQTLISALTEVATQLAQIRAIDAQLVDAVHAEQNSRRARDLALAQYRQGLTTQLTVLNAETSTLARAQAVAQLRMTRRDRQIALAASLGGGYTDSARVAPADVAMRAPVPPAAAGQPQ
ncbi:efflux transporter outer membrane subunit [Cupriavidus basilensis]|uniref:Efflux transporter outer membrane subunit n=1 Tax=Cupriavidus basilensis TaxID=68895 RepID=A0ABT6AXZ4_9BURK|nr:efflux transporter outer membrane subunit [Cupriavidus basilensis]MDF3836546.1 efflux transporter outer membrane subunit [Cupriavidus basilensis]